MAWVTWRQDRMALTGTAVLFAACAVPLCISGLRLQSAHNALARAGCLRPSANPGMDSRCGALWNHFSVGYVFTSNINTVAIALAVLPVLVGVFVGAPLLAREFEAGTAKFAWTQAVSRGRWLTGKLGWIGAGLAVLSVAFGLLVNWWLLLADGADFMTRWQEEQFGLTAITFTGWMLLMFAAGVFAGALIGRTVTAMAATAVTGALLLWLNIGKFTGMLTSLSPLHARTTLVPAALPGVFYGGSGGGVIGSNAPLTPSGSWVLNTWLTAPGGRTVSWNTGSFWNLKPSRQLAWVTSHHLTTWVTYQSAGHFWLFQSVEGGAAVLLVLLLGAATVWLARRRAA
jgi:ABC-2 family transporter protein